MIFNEDYINYISNLMLEIFRNKCLNTSSVNFTEFVLNIVFEQLTIKSHIFNATILEQIFKTVLQKKVM